jgi:hypothetical protein
VHQPIDAPPVAANGIVAGGEIASVGGMGAFTTLSGERTAPHSTVATKPHSLQSVCVGVAAPMNVSNVDTDMIIPAQFLKTIKRSGLGEYVCLSALEISKPTLNGCNHC